MTKIILIIFCLLNITTFTHGQTAATIFLNDRPPASFSITKLRNSLEAQGYHVTLNNGGIPASSVIKIFLATSGNTGWMKSLAGKVPSFSQTLEAEGFNIQQVRDNETSNIFIVGYDEAGLLYGCLELAELIRLKGISAVSNITQHPYMKRRGVKMNIPLDVRTPSYTDMSDVAQQNIPEVWSMDFWKEYLDSLASFRYNFVSLWSLHPFPSMVKVPEYPEVALHDVYRSTTTFQEYYSTRTTGFDAPEIVNNYEVVKRISMDEKIKFWQDVMQYAKARNIDFYVVTWNIYTYGTNGKYGITDDINNPVTKDYFRKSIRQLFLTYPLLAGIGLTTGENMPNADFKAKEDWSFDTYALGVLDVIKEQPDRKITLIHRQHEAGALDIVKKFSPLIESKNINFVFSFKYAQAHVYSSTKQIHHHEFVKQIQETKNFKTLWTLRNDDVYYFRWGSPDFVRDFIKNIPMEVTEGYYYGSDQYVWGREFLDKYPGGKRPIELAKHWYQWMLWGRLGYDPTTDNSRFINNLHSKFPQINSQALFDAWQSASMIYPLTTGFHYGALDFQWYIEASKSRPEPAQTPSGFHDIHRFITLPPYKATDYISIPDYVKMQSEKISVEGVTPFEVANQIHEHADRALALVKGISASDNDELYKTIEDIKAMAYLGKYYAHKINAATNLALHKKNPDPSFHRAMTGELNASALYWRYYASTALANYKNPLWTNRVGHVDWKGIYKYVLQDITDHQAQVHLSNMETTTGGTIVEAESQTKNKVLTDIKGYTGSGYVGSISGPLHLTYNAKQAGTYVLEFRYIYHASFDESFPEIPVEVNAAVATALTIWPGGTKENWVWDRVEVYLSKGKQTISLTVPPSMFIDHVNVMYR